MFVGVSKCIVKYIALLCCIKTANISLELYIFSYWNKIKVSQQKDPTIFHTRMCVAKSIVKKTETHHKSYQQSFTKISRLLKDNKIRLTLRIDILIDCNLHPNVTFNLYLMFS